VNSIKGLDVKQRAGWPGRKTVASWALW